MLIFGVTAITKVPQPLGRIAVREIGDGDPQWKHAGMIAGRELNPILVLIGAHIDRAIVDARITVQVGAKPRRQEVVIPGVDGR